MACSQSLSGLTYDCSGIGLGGIKEVYVAQWNASTIATGVTQDSTTGTVTGITGMSFVKYEFRKNTGSMTSTFNADEGYVTTEVVLHFDKMETKKRLEMSALSLDDLFVLVVDNNQKVWVLGLDAPVVASAGTGQTGANRISDRNYYEITLQSNDGTYPMEFTGDLPTVS